MGLIILIKTCMQKGEKLQPDQPNCDDVCYQHTAHKFTLVCKTESHCSVTGTHLLRSFINWKAFLMCVLLKVGILPFTVSSSASMEQFGCDIAGVATKLVRHERQCLDGGRDVLQNRYSSATRDETEDSNRVCILLLRLAAYNYSLD